MRVPSCWEYDFLRSLEVDRPSFAITPAEPGFPDHPVHFALSVSRPVTRAGY